MASNLNEILGRNIDSVKSLKQAIKELQDSLVGLDTESKEYQETAEKLAVAQDALKDTTRAGIDANLAAKDSIVGMQKEYNKLYDAYKKLSDEQRNSDFGKNMAASLEKLSTTINDSKKEVGNFTNNIGRYAQGATEAFNNMGVSLGALQTPMKLASGGAKTLGASLKALIANPVGAVIMGIVVVFKAFHAIAERVKKAIHENEETQNRLTEAMAVFRPVLDAVSNAFDFLGKIVVKVVEGLSKVAEKVMSIIPGMKKAIDSHKELAKATNELNKAQRENSVLLSQKQSEVETLRAEAAATTDVTEKRQLLEEAKAKQMEIDQEYVNMAQEELRIMQEYAAKTANSAEANDKLAAAQKKVNDAVAAGQKHQKEYNEQLKTTTQAINNQSSAGKNYREEAKKLYEQVVEDSKDEVTKLTEKYNKEKKLLEKYHYDTTLLTKKYNADVAKIEREAAARKYQQRRDDREQELNLWRDRGEEEIALALEAEKLEKKTIPAVKNLDETVTNFLESFKDNSKLPDLDAALAKMKEMEDFINDNTFEALGDEFKPIKDAVRKINDEFGLSITTVSNLGLTLEKLENKFEKITKAYDELTTENAGKEQIKQIQDAIKENYETELEGLIKSVSYDTFEGYSVFMAEQEAKALEVEKSAIEKQLNSFSGNTEQKLEIMQRYYEVLAEMREREFEAVRLDAERTRDIIGSTLNVSNSFESLLGSIEQVMEAEINSGKITEREAKRKKKALENLQKVQLAVAIANIAANTAAGIMDVWGSYASELKLNAETAAATGPAAAGVKAALDAKSLTSAIIHTSALALEGGSQIAAAVGGYISKSSAAATESEPGVAATPALINSTPYSYTQTVQTAEEEERLNQPIYVTVTDIEEGLGQRVKVTNESSF